MKRKIMACILAAALGITGVSFPTAARTVSVGKNVKNITVNVKNPLDELRAQEAAMQQQEELEEEENMPEQDLDPLVLDNDGSVVPASQASWTKIESGAVEAVDVSEAPGDALAVGLADSDICSQVNREETTFKEAYRETAEKIKALLPYAEENPYAYSYNDACTAFARGESAMYPIGSYAIPQIKSVNPDMKIDSFVFPANDYEKENVLNSGIDLQFCVMKNTEQKEAVYEVLRFLYEDEVIQIYLEDQGGIACKEGDFSIPSELTGMREYIRNDRMADFQDHHYPSEMSVDAMIQTYLLDESDNSADKFLKRFDTEWKRYNRDLIRKVQEYEKGMEDAQ